MQWASPTERSTYNLMATLPQDIMPLERLRKNARKDIGGSTDFLEACVDNRLEPQDIWRQKMRDLQRLGGLDSNLRQLENHKRTAIVARGLPIACAILRMLDEYAFGATRHHVERNLLELSDAGTLRVARFAHDMISWHFGLEEVIVAALDMATKGRAASEGEKVVPAPRLAQSLEYYPGTNLYDPTIDINSVECSCAPSVVKRLKSCANTQTIGNERRRWKTDEETANLRTLAILCLGGCWSAFASGKNSKNDSKEIARFLGTFEIAVRQYGQNPDDKPRDIENEDPPDLTLGDQDIDDTMGPVRRNSRLINLMPYKTSETIEYSVENALIVVSRVALTYGDAMVYGFRKPVVFNLWLGNGYGLTLVIAEGEPPNVPLPFEAVEYGGKRLSTDDMRAAILSMLGCSNLIVEFNLGSTLAALNLILPGHRVVDLGT